MQVMINHFHIISSSGAWLNYITDITNKHRVRHCPTDACNGYVSCVRRSPRDESDTAHTCLQCFFPIRLKRILQMLLRVDTWRSENGMHLQGFALNLTRLQNRHDHRCHLLQLLWRLGARVLRPRFKQEIDLRSRTKKDSSDQESHIVGPRKQIGVVVW